MKRHPASPVLTREDVPGRDVSSIFNPGVAARPGGGVVMLARVQTRGRETRLHVAESEDGVAFRLRDDPITIDGLEDVQERIYHVYDPRLTWLEGTLHVVFAADVDGACRLGVARTPDLERFELVSFDPFGDTRNGVLFPARIAGRFARLERPNAQALLEGVTSGDEITFALSGDLVSWTEAGTVMGGRLHYWDERIGAGPPPVRTSEGWLLVYHGIATHFAAASIYQAGVALLDFDDPTRVLARGPDNVLEPRELYEQVGQVPNVVFPSGMVVEGVVADEVASRDARVLLYYGAADTCVGLAETSVGALLDACHVS